MAGSTSKRRKAVLVVTALLGAAFAPSALAASLPSAPTGLRTTGAVTQTAATLEWNAPTSLGGATGAAYDLYRNGSKLASSSTLKFTAGYLTAGTTYTFTVRACTSNGCSPQSAAITVSTLPATPIGIRATPGNSQMTLTWRTASGTDGYRVLYRPDTSAIFTEWTQGSPSASSATVTGLQNGTLYSFKVQAYNTAGTVESGVITATPQTVPATPAAPETVTASPTATAFRWVRPSDGGSTLRGYEIWVNGALKLKTGPDAITYSLNTPLNTQAEVQLKACNVLGCSALSQSLWIGTPPNPPTNVLAVGGTKALTVSWTPSTSVGVLSHRVSYRVYGSTNPADWNEWTPGVSDTSPVVITSLSDNTRYEVRVAAHRNVGSAAASATSTSTSPPPTTTTTTTTPPTTTPPPATLQATQVATGHHHSCALLNSGAVKCWGENIYGQLGDGTVSSRLSPTPVFGLGSGVTQITVNSYHSCALLSTGAVKCWGKNITSQLGDGSTSNRLSPVQVTGLTTGVQKIAAGTEHTCALLASGAVKCWGANTYGQLGDGSSVLRSTPVQVGGLTAAVSQIAAGATHTCALLTTGAVVCWGGNFYGQLGDGTTTNRLNPTQASGLSAGVSQLTAGHQHTCAVLAAGSLKCWGSNSNGQLGDGTITQRVTPTQVSGLTAGVQKVAAGQLHTCSVLASGALKCWGWNVSFGQLGDGTYVDRNTPTQVSGLTSGIIQVAPGSHHTCALLAAGGVKCWGCNNGRSQLGDGTGSLRSTPVDVIGLLTP
jgi:hypothetical protein